MRVRVYALCRTGLRGDLKFGQQFTPFHHRRIIEMQLAVGAGYRKFPVLCIGSNPAQGFMVTRIEPLVD
ncbi:MAG: hypothetical protein WCF90_05550 [Methanomicrobiales archaeon]